MDETLKARLIGAAVLVAIAVLLVPELLSGRKAPGPADEAGPSPKGTRTFTIELEGMPGQGARAPAAGLAEPATNPQLEAPRAVRDEAPAPVREPATAEPREPAIPKPQAPAPSAVASTVPATNAAPATGVTPTAAPSRAGWYVQVGAFGSADSARKLVKELESAGYPALVSPVTRSGKTLHRVRVGPEAQRVDADRLAGRLKARGLPATVVAND
jgi:DedD protein